MKLDVSQLRYLSRDELRVLQAVEQGQKNHELVPVALIDTIAGLKHGGTIKCLKQLLKSKLVHHENTKYDGYRLTYLGYDHLAIKTLVKRGAISSLGRQIGVGKEADVFEVLGADGEVMALKLHRLGRTSFRAVKSKRDYLEHRHSFSWLYLSRLAALKEFAFMQALGEHGFPVPAAIESNRHAVLMSLVDAYPLVQVREVANPGAVYRQCIGIMSRLAAKGLVHCDFNEFNLLIDEDERLTLIDFPQMVSASHANAQELFYRDVDCVTRFFAKKLGYMPEHDPDSRGLRPDFQAILRASEGDLSAQLRASGFRTEHQAALDGWVDETCRDGGSGAAATDADDAGLASGECSASGLEEADQSLPAGDDGAGSADAGADAASLGTSEASLLDHDVEDASAGPAGSTGGVTEPSCDYGSAAPQDRRRLPSRGAVQERLTNERRRAAHSRRLQSAARNPQKSGPRKSRSQLDL